MFIKWFMVFREKNRNLLALSWDSLTSALFPKCFSEKHSSGNCFEFLPDRSICFQINATMEGTWRGFRAIFSTYIAALSSFNIHGMSPGDRSSPACLFPTDFSPLGLFPQVFSPLGLSRARTFPRRSFPR